MCVLLLNYKHKTHKCKFYFEMKMKKNTHTYPGSRCCGRHLHHDSSFCHGIWQQQHHHHHHRLAVASCIGGIRCIPIHHFEQFGIISKLVGDGTTLSSQLPIRFARIDILLNFDGLRMLGIHTATTQIVAVFALHSPILLRCMHHDACVWWAAQADENIASTIWSFGIRNSTFTF